MSCPRVRKSFTNLMTKVDRRECSNGQFADCLNKLENYSNVSRLWRREGLSELKQDIVLSQNHNLVCRNETLVYRTINLPVFTRRLASSFRKITQVGKCQKHFLAYPEISTLSCLLTKHVAQNHLNTWSWNIEIKCPSCCLRWYVLWIFF